MANNLNAIGAANPVTVSVGGTGAATLTDHGVMLGSGTGAVSVTAVGSTGEVLTGVTGGDPVWAAPANPAATSSFFAYVFNPIPNVTGDGTTYQVVFDTEVYDNGSDYNNATGAYTAPQAGIYTFSTFLYLQGILVTHTDARIQTNYSIQKSLAVQRCDASVMNSAGFFGFGYTWDAQLAAGETVSVVLNVFNGTKVVGVFGDTTFSYRSFFSGRLVS